MSELEYIHRLLRANHRHGAPLYKGGQGRAISGVFKNFQGGKGRQKYRKISFFAIPCSAPKMNENMQFSTKN